MTLIGFDFDQVPAEMSATSQTDLSAKSDFRTQCGLELSPAPVIATRSLLDLPDDRVASFCSYT